MMRINAKISTRLMTSSSYQFAGLPFGKKRVAVKGDLQKYDVVIVGGHLGPLLSSHLDGAVGQKASIFVAHDNSSYYFNTIRGFYEKGLFTSNDMLGSPKNSISKFAASSDGQGVTQFLPNQNAVILKSGRRVEYDNLVIATGLKQNYSTIKGFEEAWADEEHQFHTCNNHAAWKFGASKPYRFMYNFNGGEAIFYIPPAPFHGEIQAYNFLMTKQLWQRQDAHARLCLQNSRFTIINANDSFCPHFPQGDSFIRQQIQKKGINVEHGLKLVEVRKDDNIAVFQNSQTGQKQERPYNNFYSLIPAKPDDLLSNCGLADSNGLLDVNHQTLQHKKYENIFGFGDIANVPTTKTFYAGFNQLHVVRHNVQRRINGLQPNAKYDGLSESYLHVGYDQMTKISHLYNGEAKDSLSTGFAASLKNSWYTKNKKAVIDLLKFKNWGAPYYKFKKTFDGGATTKNPLGSLYPKKKEA